MSETRANTLHYGDNLSVLREHVGDESVDLVYLDPPFNSKADYNLLFKEPTGRSSTAQIEAFKDTWHWGIEAEAALDDLLRSPHGDVAKLLTTLVHSLGRNDLSAYLAMMAVRLVELHRVLKATGSLYLHCDPVASHYLKVILDAIFGPAGYRSEISWKRSSAHSDAKQGRKAYGSIRDVILFYTKGRAWTFNWQHTAYSEDYTESFYRHRDDEGRRYRKGDLTAARPGGDVEYGWRVRREADGEWEADLDDEWERPVAGRVYKAVYPYKGRFWAYSKENMKQFAREGRIVYTRDGMPNYKRYLDEMPGVPLQNDWQDIAPALGAESLGYPTQKPVALLKRIIEVSSNEGDVVLDPFCGCGTAIHAAQALRRKWVGIDITHLAISLIERRLDDAFPGIAFDVVGTPRDVESARALAASDKYQFQWWAVSLVGAQPFAGKKKGADSGIDGRIYFRADAKSVQTCIVSVKGGEKVGVEMIRDLRGVMSREGAPVGIFITLNEPTEPMRREAANAGFYESELFGKIPALQIFTIGQLLDPEGPRPVLRGVRDGMAFKKAERAETSKQNELPL